MTSKLFIVGIIIVKFIYPICNSVFKDPVGVPVQLSQSCFVLDKVYRQWLRYHVLKKIWWYLKPFKCNMRKDDGWMGTQMDGQNCYISIQGVATWRTQWHVIIPEPRATLWVLPLREFNVMIPEPHATLQGERIPSAILKIVFRRFFIYCFLNAVWALASGGFRIVSDTLVCFAIQRQ